MHASVILAHSCCTACPFFVLYSAFNNFRHRHLDTNGQLLLKAEGRRKPRASRAVTREPDGPSTQEVQAFLANINKEYKQKHAAADTAEAWAAAAAQSQLWKAAREADEAWKGWKAAHSPISKAHRKEWGPKLVAAERRLEDACKEDLFECERDRLLEHEAAERHRERVQEAAYHAYRRMKGLPAKSYYSDSSTD